MEFQGFVGSGIGENVLERSKDNVTFKNDAYVLSDINNEHILSILFCILDEAFMVKYSQHKVCY